MSKAAITTHILNLHLGKPARGVAVSLRRTDSDELLGTGVTDADGRISQWDKPLTLHTGSYILQFELAAWYERQALSYFFPQVQLVFQVTNVQEHYHVPLLLNAYGYSTYRGS